MRLPPVARCRSAGHDARRPRDPGCATPTPARFPRRAGRRVCVLHQRHDHGLGGAAEQQPVPVRSRYQAGAQRQSMPLRLSPADRARRPACCRRLRMTLSRRAFLGGSGALIVSFGLLQTSVTYAQSTSVPQGGEGQPSTGSGSPQIDPKQVDSWLAVGQDGRVTIFSGRVELGTGTRTALAQIAADELYVPFDSITMVQGDTGRTPDEGYTAGSKTVQVGGVNVRKAAAEARQALLEIASEKLGVQQTDITFGGDGFVFTTPDP